MLKEFTKFIKQFREEEMPQVHEALKEMTNEIRRGKLCSNCRRPYETQFESRSAYLVRGKYVCQLCYENAKMGTWDIRKELRERSPNMTHT